MQRNQNQWKIRFFCGGVVCNYVSNYHVVSNYPALWVNKTHRQYFNESIHLLHDAMLHNDLYQGRNSS